MVDREELVGYITNHHPCEKNMCPSSGMCRDCAKELLREYENEIITSFENSIISILGEIRAFVWDRDIPSATCPEYIEHHNDCVEIMNFISEKIDMFRGRSNEEIANMLKEQNNDKRAVD